MEENDEKSAEKEASPAGWPFIISHPRYWHHTLKEVITSLGMIVTIIVALGILYLLADIVSLYFDPDAKDRFSNLRTSLFILAALIGVPFFLWRTWIAQQQSDIAQYQAETARDRSYTELFTKAVEQLGAEKKAIEILTNDQGEKVTFEDGYPKTWETYVPNIEVRIGAIFALERIMKDSDKDAPAIVDTLAAYVRENCGKQTLECKIPEQEKDQTTGDWVKAIKNYVGSMYNPKEGTLLTRARALNEQPQVNRSDIKTALTVLGRRPEHLKHKDAKQPDLRSVNFQGWELHNFDLSYCDLSNAKMQGANLSGAEMQEVQITSARKTAASSGDVWSQNRNNTS